MGSWPGVPVGRRRGPGARREHRSLRGFGGVGRSPPAPHPHAGPGHPLRARRSCCRTLLGHRLCRARRGGERSGPGLALHPAHPLVHGPRCRRRAGSRRIPRSGRLTWTARRARTSPRRALRGRSERARRRAGSSPARGNPGSARAVARRGVRHRHRRGRGAPASRRYEHAALRDRRERDGRRRQGRTRPQHSRRDSPDDRGRQRRRNGVSQRAAGASRQFRE